MKLKVLMRANGVSDSFDAQLAYRGSLWLLERLLTPAQQYGLDISVAMRNPATLGGCLGKFRTYLGRPSTFTVMVNRQQGDYMKLRALCHEFVHLHQFVRGDLVYRRIGETVHTYWQGVDHTETAYDDCPWEIEAHEQEKELARAFLRTHPLWWPAFDPRSR